MRLLFARVGRTICRKCGQEVIRETAEVVANRLLALPEGTRLLLGFDLPSGERQPNRRLAQPMTPDDDGDEPRRDRCSRSSRRRRWPLETLRRKGFGRLLVDGQAVAFEDVDAAALKAMTVLRVVVDRVKVDGRCAHANHRFGRNRRTRKAAARPGPSSCRWRRHADHALSSPSGSSAARAASRTRIRSRACSRSTTRSARARRATASATSSSSTRTWWCPIRRSRSTRARLSRGPSRTTARSSPS